MRVILSLKPDVLLHQIPAVLHAGLLETVLLEKALGPPVLRGTGQAQAVQAGVPVSGDGLADELDAQPLSPVIREDIAQGNIPGLMGALLLQPEEAGRLVPGKGQYPLPLLR